MKSDEAYELPWFELVFEEYLQGKPFSTPRGVQNFVV